MTNEAVLLKETDLPIPFTCANGTGIEKGALLTLSDPNTAALCTVSRTATAGVCAYEKIASDGITKVSAYTGGEFKFTLSGAITVGDPFQFTGQNKIEQATHTADTYTAGHALETGADGETIRGRLGPGRLVN